MGGSIFNEVSLDNFLKVYWQQKHLAVKNAFPNFLSPLSAEELAGYSLEEEINSRLIIEEKGSWKVQHGPLDESVFSTLPASHWTLLVQNVDALNEEVNELLDHFRFIPNWRLDDIMISYATDQGSVGPHFDYYDVFLLQASGARRWKIGQQCDSHSSLLPDQDMKVLADFEEQEEHLMEPGDLLYLPPGRAHWGIAEGDDCMTISVGFRAPSYAELFLEFAEEIASEMSEDQRYRDSNLQIQENPGEIRREVIDNVQGLLSELVRNKQKVASIFGNLMTSNNQELSFDHEGGKQKKPGYTLHPTVRSAWHELDNETILFLNGSSWKCSRKLACELCNNKTINRESASPSDRELLDNLLDQNLVCFKK